MVLTLQEIQDARNSLVGKVMLSPLVSVGTTTPGGAAILLKAESLQPSGSFKIRGANHAISRLTDRQRAAGVVAYSTGNHAQAVALAAKQQGISATIVMSPDAPAFKVEATQAFGATVVMAESTSQARRQLAEALARAEGLVLLPPYDDLTVMAGQATIGSEILEQTSPGAVFVPVGGGGLLAGIASAIKQKAPSVRIIGVEPEWENDAWQSFQQGRLVALSASSLSIADAIRVQVLGDLTYPLICRYVDEMVTVTEEQIARATILAASDGHLIVEPAGALGLAAAMAYRDPLPGGRPVVAVASGGNMTLETLHRLQAGGG